MKEKGYNKILDSLGVSVSQKNQKKLDETIAVNSDLIVPYEVVTPPIPISKMKELHKLQEGIRRQMSPSDRISFVPRGLHINPEVFSFEVQSILNIIRSFSLSFDQLVQDKKIDITRRISPYIKPFPKNYIKLITQKDYQPDMKTLVKDYLTHNPTRNRALDLTPLFAYIDKNLIVGYEGLEYSLIKARPTFHYRLPNCEIHNESWHISDEWNSWVEIESLALCEDRLSKKIKNYTEKNKSFLESD